MLGHLSFMNIPSVHIPVPHITFEWGYTNSNIKATTPSYAITIRKSQGQTLQKAVAN